MAVLLADLVLATRQQANVENNNFVTDVEVRNRLNEAKLDLYDLIIDVDESAYATQSQTFTLAGGFGQNSITLPSDFYRMKGVDRSPGQTSIETVQPLPSFLERNSGGRFWMLSGTSTVQIVRPELAAGPYLLWYYPLMLELYDPAIPIVAGVDSVVASIHAWSFSTATFDSRFVGASMTVAGASHGTNNALVTITQVLDAHTIVTTGTQADETFGSAVTASAQPLTTEPGLDVIMTPWRLYLELHAARGIQAKRGKDTSDLTIRLEGADGQGGQKKRVQDASRRRRGAPQQVPRRRGGSPWNLGGNDGDF